MVNFLPCIVIVEQNWAFIILVNSRQEFEKTQLIKFCRCRLTILNCRPGAIMVQFASQCWKITLILSHFAWKYYIFTSELKWSFKSQMMNFNPTQLINVTIQLRIIEYISIETSMHSSRMRTAHLLTTSRNIPGVSFQGRSVSRGVSGVCVRGGCVSGGVSKGVCVCPGGGILACNGADTPSCEQNHRQV